MAIREILEEELENSLRMERGYSARLDQLPKGSLVKRVRNQREYYYIVYRKDGKVCLDYVGKCASEKMKEEYREAKKKRAQYRRLRSQVRQQIKFIKRALRGKQAA
jgi:hypothetical protein